MLNRNELILALKKDNVKVIFEKVNGNVRKMLCTLREDAIPKTTVKKKENKDVLVVWDLGKKAWRSFRMDSITKIEPIKRR
ncbi:MAG TPA: DUF2693 domain-containing protein [Flavobacteriaceae bacterium]|jgi:hypothetical protein|nr:DUF2693 domain-containing protein [Flavobacteriaceae bacterium]